MSSPAGLLIAARRRPLTILPRHEDVASQTLYRFYDANGVLLYVGITHDPEARWGHHARNKHWWRRVARIDVEHLDSRTLVADAEKAAILAERPVHNFVYNADGLPDPESLDRYPTDPQHFARRCEQCSGTALQEPAGTTWQKGSLLATYRCQRDHTWAVNWGDAMVVIRDCSCSWCSDPKRRRLEVVGRHWF